MKREEKYEFGFIFWDACWLALVHVKKQLKTPCQDTDPSLEDEEANRENSSSNNKVRPYHTPSEMEPSRDSACYYKYEQYVIRKEFTRIVP